MRPFKIAVQRAIEEATGKRISLNELTYPPDPKLGDLASRIAFELPGNPKENAEALAKKIKRGGMIKNVKAYGPYLNFFADWDALSKAIVEDALKEGYGKGKQKKEKVMVEFSQPNTHKAFHVGHLRNVCLGDSLVRILRYNGYETIAANYLGDTGTHVAKVLWCLEKFHKGEKPEKNKGRWLGEIYKEAAQKLKENPAYEEEVRNVYKRLFFDKERELVDLWKKTRQWSIEEFDRIYRELGVTFDTVFFESEVEEPGVELVKQLVEKGIAKLDQGAVIVDLKDKGLGVFLLLRSDGTPLYSTKDLYLAKKKFEEYNIDVSIYVVGSEQKLYFKQLFETLRRMGFKQADKCYHLAYELVVLKSGKMKSREGNVILYEDFAKEAIERARKAVEEKNPKLSEEEKQSIAKVVGIGAIKYGMLKVSNNKTIVFDWETALDFNGESAPYIQYAYVRAKHILEKSTKNPKAGALTTESEKNLLKKIGEFPDVLEDAASHYSPHLIANYAYELAYTFNSFYNSEQVIGSDKEEERLALVLSTADTIKACLDLLGIAAPSRM
ncbi:MAG: arginine--tRNA ligase [Candidatus Diapherotrites archaeon]|nr:arginine--tRNA ligase [Candidatus Diapherotrites archaeon]